MLKNATLWAASALLALGLNSCGGDTQESLMEEMHDGMGELVTVCEGIKDEASAKAAVPKIEAIATTLKAIAEKGKALGEPSEELKKKWEPKMEELGKKLMPAMMKLAQYPDVMKKVEEAMKALGD